MPRIKGQDLNKAMENNSLYLKVITRMFLGLGKEALGVGAATLLDCATRERAGGGTLNVDSGRAIANWDLQIGGTNPFGREQTVLDPPTPMSKGGSKYADSRAFESGLGTRESHGVPAKDHVPKLKAVAYGYTIKAGKTELETGGWIHTKLGIGVRVDQSPSQTKAVHLFNPILGAVVNKDGYGRRYATNAFPGMETPTAVANATRGVVLENARWKVEQIIKSVKDVKVTYRGRRR